MRAPPTHLDWPFVVPRRMFEDGIGALVVVGVLLRMKCPLFRANSVVSAQYGVQYHHLSDDDDGLKLCSGGDSDK